MHNSHNEDVNWFAVYEKLAATEDILHEGTPHEGSIPHSGRYPYGSGLAAYQHIKDFNSAYNRLLREGVPRAEIAKGFGMSIQQMDAKITENNEVWKHATAVYFKELMDQGYSVTGISKMTGIKRSTVNDAVKDLDKRAEMPVHNTKEVLKRYLDEGYAVDYGAGVEQRLGVNETNLVKAARLLEMEGYENYSDISFPQATNQKQFTQMRVLAPKGMSKADILEDMTVIRLPFEYSEDGGETFQNRKPPVNIDRDRIYVRYAEDGGKDRDGTIELRRGVPDLDLGDANYAQVRIAVEGGKYMKGMCYYGDVPEGYDLVYNTNKKRGTPDFKYDPDGKVKGGVFKEQDKEDIYNPFGASIKDEDELKLIRTKTYIDKDGKKQQSALNIISEEGDWENWSNTLASQFLSKQSPKLAKQQLDKAYKEHVEEYKDILKISNPYVKEQLLRSFADECDSDAVHLKAAAFPRQGTHVILPEPSLKPNEIFAPKYENGEEVILVRYPHGGIFEIPKLVVNNDNKKCQKKYTLNAKDAIAIHPSAAAQLSGADFDGDTCLVIPTKGREFKTMDYLPGLKDFDPDIWNRRDVDKKYKSLTKKNKGKYMGVATNLINDMTVGGASWDEIERAIKYSMVVIDSPKHDLDYRSAYKEYGIDELQQRYQVAKTGSKGAATLMSRAKGETRVKDRLSYYHIDPNTGEKIFYAKTKDGKQYRVELGEPAGTYDKKLKSTQMYETKDARTLSSGTRIENIYADYANSLKSLGDEARLSSTKVGDIPHSKAAEHVYADEVASIKNKLARSNMNAPMERQANLIANREADLKLAAKYDYDKDDEKKVRNLCIKEARARLGAKHYDIDLTEKEWEALNNGAVNKTTQKELFKKIDDDKLKKEAMPKTHKTMSDNQVALAKALSASGYSIAEIASRLGFSTTAVSNAIK